MHSSRTVVSQPLQVTGNTIYNLDAMGEYETGPDDRPLYPPRITSVEVILNPFDDIVPRRHALITRPWCRKICDAYGHRALRHHLLPCLSQLAA